ncbi:MAG: TPM domain-containing protein [Ferruginibacter sp.]|nr:TPM domain-containing protein [Cytophagales bacterium]
MAKDFFTEAQKERIVEAIRRAETHTSGEIRVHVELRCPLPDVMERAKDVFGQLDLHRTQRQNGVLFYLSLEDRKFAILGDQGIDAVVPDGFWQNTKEAMRSLFGRGELTEGLCRGIEMAGEQLKGHFPRTPDDANELSDDLSFGNQPSP